MYRNMLAQHDISGVSISILGFGADATAFVIGY